MAKGHDENLRSTIATMIRKLEDARYRALLEDHVEPVKMIDSIVTTPDNFRLP